MKKIRNIVLMITVVLAVSSCKKLVDIPDPIDTSTSAKIFNNDAQADQAVAGLYSQMMTERDVNFTFGFAAIHGGLAADEFKVSNETFYPEYVEIANNNILSGNTSSYNELWTSAYRIIYTANAILDGEAASNASTLTTAKRNELKANAKFVRAFCYFYLTGFYGRVPLAKSSKYNENIKLGKATQTEIYASLVTDLKEAIEHYNASNVAITKSKGNALSAEALLARVYLYQKDWENAKIHADNVIKSGRYSLPTLANTFTNNSTEAIFQLARSADNSLVNIVDITYMSPMIPIYLFPPGDQAMFLDKGFYDMMPEAFIPPLKLNTPLINAFEPADNRASVWANYNGSPVEAPYNGEKTYFAIKYAFGVSEEFDYMVMRLAEMYLIRAEANAHLDFLSLVEDDLEVIRNRAGLTNQLALADKDAALTAVAKERQTELFAEWGHRFFDLKRTGKAVQALGQLPNKAGVNLSRLDFPIPEQEIIKNPKLGRD